MAWLARLFLGPALKWWIMGSVAAGAIAVSAGLVEYGIYLRASKVKDQLMEQVQVNRDRNFKVDRSTINRDSELTQKLQEIERTWSDSSSPQ